ncbi:MAG: hypothetical protein CBB79_04790 [Synechococcus sp. TMED19]|nr:MAG: hypothetical protein CBB79_04790 [Synechococcus sp. TMED19]
MQTTAPKSTTKYLIIELNQSLACFTNKLAKKLVSQGAEVQRWCFNMDPDEACQSNEIVQLLQNSLTESGEPTVLIAHGISSVIAYQLTAAHPDHVKALVLLSADASKHSTWQDQYHKIRKMLPCSRKNILTHLSHLLTGHNCPHFLAATTKLLEKSVDSEFCLSSIGDSESAAPYTKAKRPILVVNGDNDFIIDRNSKNRWSHLLKDGDRYLSIKGGRHFHQHTHAEQLADEIMNFTEMLSSEKKLDECISSLSRLRN